MFYDLWLVSYGFFTSLLCGTWKLHIRTYFYVAYVSTIFSYVIHHNILEIQYDVRWAWDLYVITLALRCNKLKNDNINI